MDRTAEARWFFPGRYAPAQVAWFTHGELVEREKRRTDRYLDLAGNPDLGIKQREGKLELKARAAPARIFKLAEIAGRKDAWVKSSLALRGMTRAGASSRSASKRRAPPASTGRSRTSSPRAARCRARGSPPAACSAIRSGEPRSDDRDVARAEGVPARDDIGD